MEAIFTRMDRSFVLICFLYSNCLEGCTSVVTEETVLSLQNAYTMLSEDIQQIKAKLWVETSTKLELLSKHNKELEALIQQCQCAHRTDGTDEEKPVDDSSIQEETKANHINKFGQLFARRFKVLDHGFRAEKKRASRIEHHVNELRHSVDMLSRDYSEVKEIVLTNTNLANANGNSATDNKRDIETLNATCDILSKSQSTLSGELETLKDHLNESNIAINSFLAERSSSTKSFKEPGFVSEWLLMKSQDKHLSNRSIPHHLGGLPVKVEVQVKPASGPNAGWIFHGDSAFLADDDLDMNYGGIVYLYDDQEILLFAPNKNNNNPSGSAIYTGYDPEYRLGNNHQRIHQVYVRVKAWGPRDAPIPDFVSPWQPLSIFNKSTAFYDIPHGLATYPSMVNIQIKVSGPKGNLVSEGIGASMDKNGDWSNGGGTVWAYSDKSVRVWTSYIQDHDQYVKKGFPHLSLVGSPDGWGYWKILAGMERSTGQMRISAWSDLDASTHEQKDTMFYDWHTLAANNPSADLLSIHVKANDGDNAGYYFKGFGSSQVTTKPFGGLVYAFNAAGQIRLWPPNSAQGGHLININQPYGNGVNVQTSDNATYVSTTVKCRM